MLVTKLELEGLILITLPVHKDSRGFFVERFQVERFWEHGLPTHFFQDNHSRSFPGVLRGLHYQRRPSQGKLVGVTRGRIWDVVVDLRPDSATFGRNLGMEISDNNGLVLWIPPGFAHGFCVLGEEASDVVYKVDSPYNPAGEGGICWNDPDLAIPWPIRNPNVSARDQQLVSFASYKKQPVRWEQEMVVGKEQVTPVIATSLPEEEGGSQPRTSTRKVIS